jgi:hypothetical protein
MGGGDILIYTFSRHATFSENAAVGYSCTPDTDERNLKLYFSVVSLQSL